MKIFKYRLPFMENASIEMPLNAKVIRVDEVEGVIWVWAVVDTDFALYRKEFRLFKTGADMPDDILDETKYKYVGCGAIFVQMELMMYVYEVL